jgi:hypothetical protein
MLSTKYTNRPLDTPNDPDGHEIYQDIPFQGPQKYTIIEVFGLKIYLLATLLSTEWVKE